MMPLFSHLNFLVLSKFSNLFYNFKKYLVIQFYLPNYFIISSGVFLDDYKAVILELMMNLM